MPKIDIDSLKIDTRSGYPEPFREVTVGRERKRLGRAVGLDQLGINLSRLKPGAQSSQRHWHTSEDEFVYIIEGEAVLLDNAGETLLRAGDAAGWKAGVADGHCLVNRSTQDVVFLEIGSRAETDRVDYPDVDLMVVRDEQGQRYTHKSGEPYPEKKS